MSVLEVLGYKTQRKLVLCAQSSLTLCNPMDFSSPGSCIHGIFQARILEQVAISFSRGSLLLRDWNLVLCLVHRQVDSLPLHHLGSPKEARSDCNYEKSDINPKLIHLSLGLKKIEQGL